MTTGQAASLLGIGERAVRQAIQRGRLPAVRVGGRWVIEREDLEQYRQAVKAA
ncbi:helix-turn-helix domain-containing protein [Pseudactinotalea sp. Z1739]|uniref:helix-turn-helix domain-containing protein n=1 Tax=Pseudactinotalea sp. Z1739 TaxID=3413028 RepID=UPI003C79CEF7